MAVTKGHGNPNWTRDEVILALELYQLCNGVIPNKKDARIIELSLILRKLPIHKDAAKNTSFRNEDGVTFKLQNLAQIATGKGLGNTSQVDRSVWKELGEFPEIVRQIASQIRSEGKINNYEFEDPENIEFFEGKILTQTHLRRERHRGIRKALLKDRRAKNKLFCEGCGVTSCHLPDEISDALFEAHHELPLSNAGERKTHLKDMALLCANCHRLIHRASAQMRRWISVKEFNSYLNNPDDRIRKF